MELPKYRIVRMTRHPFEMHYIVERNDYGTHWNKVGLDGYSSIREAEQFIEKDKMAKTPWKKEVIREYS